MALPFALSFLSCESSESTGRIWKKGKGPTQKARNGWLGSNNTIRAELIEYGGEKFDPRIVSSEIIDEPDFMDKDAVKERLAKIAAAFDTPDTFDVSDMVASVVRGCGLSGASVRVSEDARGRGPARWTRSIDGTPEASTKCHVHRGMKISSLIPTKLAWTNDCVTIWLR